SGRFQGLQVPRPAQTRCAGVAAHTRWRLGDGSESGRLRASSDEANMAAVLRRRATTTVGLAAGEGNTPNWLVRHYVAAAPHGRARRHPSGLPRSPTLHRPYRLPGGRCRMTDDPK